MMRGKRISQLGLRRRNLKRNQPKTRKRIGLFILALSFSWIIGAWAEEWKPDLPKLSPQQTIDMILTQVAKAQKEAQTIKAEFIMEKRMSLLASPALAKGILCITKPDKIYWEVKEPIANTLIVNGPTLWMYYPTLRQVDKVDISGKQKMLTRYIGMNEEGAIIKENYKIQMLNSPDEKGIFRLDLIPKLARTSKRVSRVRVWVDSKTWFLTRIDLWEPSGDYSSVKLKDVRVNGPVSDSIYDFRPPPGTTVNEPLQPSPLRSER